jgi:hypothetical protein
MTFGFVALIVICGWSLLSIVTSLTIGAIADARDAEPAPADRVLADISAVSVRPDAARQHHLAS